MRWAAIATLRQSPDAPSPATLAASVTRFPLVFVSASFLPSCSTSSVLSVLDPATLADEVDVVLEQVLSTSGVERPQVAQTGPVAGGTGRDGRHSEAMGRLLAEMQSVARAHPLGTW